MWALLALTIVGYNDTSAIFQSLNALFRHTHPSVEIKTQLKGTATAAPFLTLGLSDLAPMGAEFSNMELAAYRSFTGTDPVSIRIAHCSLDPSALSAPVGIYLNRANPLQNLTASQVARMFTAGNRDGDLTRWGQLGLTGDWAARPIHPAGIAEEAAAGLSAFMLQKWSGRPFTRDYDGLLQSTEVARRVNEDPGSIGFASANIVLPNVKLASIDQVALIEPNLTAGKYPYDRYLLIYFRRLDSTTADYLRLVLSPEGQQAIAAAAPHYLPLNEPERALELAKLDGPNPAPSSPASSTPEISIYRLVAGISQYVLLDREIWPLEARPFRQTYGYDPACIRVAHASDRGVYIHPTNPLSSLSLDQLTRIFTAGSPAGDLTRWSQLGWTDRAIHPYGPHDNGGFATGLRHSRLHGFPFTRAYEPLSTDAELRQAVAADFCGIALAESREPDSSLKWLSVAGLSSFVNLYINRPPGKRPDPATAQYARHLLSPTGQAELAGQGYHPLNAAEIAAELAAL